MLCAHIQQGQAAALSWRQRIARSKVHERESSQGHHSTHFMMGTLKLIQRV